MANENIFVGVLLVTLLLGGIVVITLDQSKVRLKIDNDKSTFYVQENGKFVVSGREYNRLINKTTTLDRSVSKINITTIIKNDTSQSVIVKRTTPYVKGPVIVDTYKFDGTVSEVELFPIYHTVEIFNGSGLNYRYTVDDLVGTGPKRKLTSETTLSFGRNMKVEFEPDYTWAWVGYPYGADSFSAQYKINSNYEKYNLKFFDPISVSPTSYWKFNENGFPLVANDSKVNLNFTLNNTISIMQIGKLGNAIRVNNSASKVAVNSTPIPNNLILDSNPFTIAFWINGSNGDGGNGFVVLGGTANTLNRWIPKVAL